MKTLDDWEQRNTTAVLKLLALEAQVGEMTLSVNRLSMRVGSLEHFKRDVQERCPHHNKKLIGFDVYRSELNRGYEQFVCLLCEVRTVNHPGPTFEQLTRTHQDFCPHPACNESVSSVGTPYRTCVKCGKGNL